jgi:iron(III) transport system ATP-binding protein
VSNISISHLTKRYAARTVIDDLSMDIADGEMLVLLGPSGCGKSTLLRCVAGLERPDAGRIALDQRVVFDGDARAVVPPYDRNVGFVFQSFALWPHMTVAQNVAFPLRMRKLLKEHRDRIGEVLAKVRCAELADRLPSELSGGQQQRVALARALVAEPKVMLLDEPLSNLDALLRLELRQQLREIHQAFGFTGLFVTHDQAEALHVGSRVALMRDGRIEQIGSPSEVYETPATPYAARFLGVQNLVALADGAVALAGICAPALASLGADGPGQFVLGFRARDLVMQAGRSTMFGADHLTLGTGRIGDMIYLGDTVECSIDVQGVALHASVPRASAWMRAGAEVSVGVPAAALLVYREGRLTPGLPGAQLPQRKLA